MKYPHLSLLIIAFLSLVIRTEASNLLSSAETKAPPIEEASEYKIKANDLLRIEVVGEEETRSEVRIEADGKIKVPHIKELINAGGKTTNELVKLLTEKYNEVYVNPHVRVLILEHAIRRVNVLGEVNNPGFVIIPPGKTLTFSEAITGANGYNRIADLEDIILTRKDQNGKKVTSSVNLIAILKHGAHDPLLSDGDSIFVEDHPIGR